MANKIIIKKFEDKNVLVVEDDFVTDISTKADLVDGKVPANQLPSYVDDVLEYANLAALPGTGATGIIYVTIDNNKTYRWTGSVYVEIATSETATTLGALVNASGVATPNDTDLIATAEASGLLKKLSWTNAKAFLKTYFDTLYGSIEGDLVFAEYYAGLPATGEAGKLYVTTSDNKIYKYEGGFYILITEQASGLDYDATDWDNNFTPPTKGAVRDKIELIESEIAGKDLDSVMEAGATASITGLKNVTTNSAGDYVFGETEVLQGPMQGDKTIKVMKALEGEANINVRGTEGMGVDFHVMLQALANNSANQSYLNVTANADGGGEIAFGAEGKVFHADSTGLWSATYTAPAEDEWGALAYVQKQYVDGIIAAANAMVYKGVIDCSTNPDYPAASAGWMYVVSVAGKIGGASGTNVEAGDMVLCNTDGTVTGNQATVGAYWNIIQRNIDGYALLSGATFTGAISATNLSGTNTGDNATNTQYSGLAASKADLAGNSGQDFIANAFNVGNADTTITRSQAGVIAVEGVVIPSISSTNTLTNKRKQPRVVTTTQSATPTINTDNGDIFSITGLAQAITSFTTNLSGTPVVGEMMMIQITDDGTARAITWGASFSATTVSLPTTTVISTTLRAAFQWNGTTWVCISAV